MTAINGINLANIEGVTINANGLINFNGTDLLIEDNYFVEGFKSLKQAEDFAELVKGEAHLFRCKAGRGWEDLGAAYSGIGPEDYINEDYTTIFRRAEDVDFEAEAAINNLIDYNEDDLDAEDLEDRIKEIRETAEEIKRPILQYGAEIVLANNVKGFYTLFDYFTTPETDFDYDGTRYLIGVIPNSNSDEF